jgi:hypothetical protein
MNPLEHEEQLQAAMQARKTYKVFRKFFKTGRKFTLIPSCSLEVAQAHCKNPESSSSKCTSKNAKRRTALYGNWMDCYTAI